MFYIGDVDVVLKDDDKLSYANLYRGLFDDAILGEYFDEMSKHDKWRFLGNRYTSWYAPPKCTCCYRYGKVRIKP